jgi:undecaprenyl-diphosphatase
MISRPARAFSALALVAAAISLVYLSEEVLAGETCRFDARVREAIHAAASPAMTAFMRWFTYAGSLPALGCLAVALVLVFRKRGWRSAAVTLAVTMAGACVLVESLKHAFHRARPEPWFGIAPPDSFSYPSGHALYSFAFFVTATTLAAARVRTQWARALVWAAAGIVILLVGLSRIYLGVHYPTDVLAGFLIAFVWVLSVGLAGGRDRRAGR